MKTTKNIFNFDPTIKNGADIANENNPKDYNIKI